MFGPAPVILSEAKDPSQIWTIPLLRPSFFLLTPQQPYLSTGGVAEPREILRGAQDDGGSTERSPEPWFICFAVTTFSRVKKQYYVYITASRSRRLYIGVTNDLSRRIYEHKSGLGSQFARKYNMTSLVHFEMFDDPSQAIDREKQLKGWKRQRKINLIESGNPDWRDLSSDWN